MKQCSEPAVLKLRDYWSTDHEERTSTRTVWREIKQMNEKYQFPYSNINYLINQTLQFISLRQNR